MKLDFGHDRVIIDPRVAKLRMLGLCSASSGVAASQFGPNAELDKRIFPAITTACGT